MTSPLTSTVGRSLLHKFSPRGGSTGNRELDVPRVARLMQESTPDELYEFLLIVARDAREDADRDRRHNQTRLARDLEDINRNLDSLALHRFIEEYKARPHEELERLRSAEDVAARHAKDFRLPTGTLSRNDLQAAVHSAILAALEEGTRA